ncbi:MAG: hypothetical protein JJD92_06560 [Frankiaceae bacterium]|nr:hypothetical protein [Frankiaceae bacterium]
MAGAAGRVVGALASATLLAGVVSAATVDSSAPGRPAAAVCAAACSVVDGVVVRPVPVPLKPAATRRPAPAATARAPRPKPPQQRRTPVAPTARRTPAPLPARAASKSVQLRRMPAAPDPATAAAMNAMRLTPAGYRAFLDRIDQSSYDYAQQFIEFDPARVPIEQGPSEVFVWHFTTFYRNADGPAATPTGDMAVRPFVQGMARRGDEDSSPNHVCCGVNWVIDRHGPAHQLAPVNAKLRHNPPYDSINTGVEVEAARQVDITTSQYEGLAYLTVAVLDTQNLLGRKPLSEIAKGHGEMRDAYLDARPDSELDSRDDFNAPEARLLRQVIERFLRANPSVARMSPRLR